MFTESNHTYRNKNGEKVPSATQILNAMITDLAYKEFDYEMYFRLFKANGKFDSLPQLKHTDITIKQVMGNYTNKGSELHSEVENDEQHFIRRLLNSKTEHITFKERSKSLIKEIGKCSPEKLLMEVPAVHEDLGYGGKYDYYNENHGILGDLKTGRYNKNKLKKARIQLLFYAELIIHHGGFVNELRVIFWDYKANELRMFTYNKEWIDSNIKIVPALVNSYKFYEAIKDAE